MRGKPFAASVLSIASGLVSLVVAFTSLTGCGGNISGGAPPPPPPTITSATIKAASATVAAGNPDIVTPTVTGTGSYVNTSNLSVSPTNAGTLSASANVPSGTAVTFTASSAISAATTVIITATSTGDSSKTGTVTITVNPATVTVSSVTLVCSPTSITMSQTATCVGTVHKSDGSTDSLVSFTATDGTITSAGIFTPTSVGSASFVAKSTEDPTKSSAPYIITVTQDASTLPNIDSLSPPWLYADAEDPFQPLQINGSNFASGQTLTWNGFPLADMTVPSGFSSTQLSLSVPLATGDYSPGWINLSVCENSNDTNCGTMGRWAFTGNQNILAIAPDGTIIALDQAQGAPDGQNGYLRAYDSKGNSTASCLVGALRHSIAIDDKTGFVIVDGAAYDAGEGTDPILGGCSVDMSPFPPTYPSGTTMASGAKGGYQCSLQSYNSTDNLSCYDLTGGPFSPATLYTATVGNQPWSLDMGTFGTETDAFVFSRNDASLHNVRASDAFEETKPLVLPGITPASARTDPNTGGWYVSVFDSGPASGIIAVLSTTDGVIDLVNASTMTVIGSPIKLPGVPFRMTKDIANGKIIIAFADVADGITTYSSIDPMAANPASTLTVLQSTDTLLSVGLGVSTDGTKLYSAQRSALHVPANQ